MILPINKFVTLLKYVIPLLILAVIGSVIVWYFGREQEIKTELIASSAPEPGSPYSGPADQLWFLPGGSFVTVKKDVGVSLWQAQGQVLSEERIFDYPQIFQYINKQEKRTFGSPSRVITPGGLQAPFDLDPAVAPDGSKIAVYHRGILALFPHHWKGNGEDVQITYLDSPPSALALEENLVALGYANGRVEVRSTAHFGLVQYNFFGRKPELMKFLRGFLYVVYIEEGRVRALDPQSLWISRIISYPTTSVENFQLEVSDKGRMAIGNGSNNVYLSDSDPSGNAYTPWTAYGSVKAFSFLDNHSLVVGGNFQHVYLLADGKAQYKLADASSGVNALAVNANQLAYAGPDGVALLRHGKKTVLNKLAWATIMVFGLILLVAHALYRTEQKSSTEIDAGPPVPLPEDVQPEVRHLGLPEVPAALVKAFRAGECVLYCGSGVSAQAGFPYWQPFVENLTEWVIRNKFVEPVLGASLRAALAQGQYDSVSDNLVSIMRERESQLNEYLRETFHKKTPLPDSVTLLKSLPFSAAMTTNFDNLLEEAFADKKTPVLTPSDAEVLLQCLHKREFFLLKLYGKLERPATVMLAPSQYDDVVKGNLLFAQFMETLLISRTVFFAGSSLEGIQAYLKGMPLSRQNLRTHYALVPVTGEAWQAKANPLKERYGIEVLPYSPSAGHPEMQRFLQNLNEKLKEESEGTTADLDEGTVLKKISVTDVGPFENLELNLDPHWNILLGDNGVGKSSIIKAIAVAILGEDSKAYAQRIIKAGQSNSVITLVTARNIYTTKLFRKNGEARVESLPGRPFEAEGWLAIGFPPLRTVSWVRPTTAQTKTKGRPTPDDLLPVIVGEADPRLDKLKQWIVNIDYWIKDARSRNENEDAQEYERLLQDFFDVVGQLTTGTEIKFKEVKAQTNEITIITEDGELPIEALSQGMTSLIGWVGILLQRLYEVYGTDEDPKLRYALVLMDEIDAHLHPAWQQSLIRNLGKIFPNVQFIATTHSPLIVGGMKTEQIVRFARDEDGKVVTYEVNEEMTIGRADQILAGDLFGLESTFTLNEDLEVVMKEYHDLLAKRRNETEELRFQKLREILKTRIPFVGETPAEQKAMGLIQALLQSESDGKYQSVNDNVLKQAEQLLNEVAKKRK